MDFLNVKYDNEEIYKSNIFYEGEYRMRRRSFHEEINIDF